MAVSYITVRVRVHIAWWWHWYAFGVTTVALLTNSEPDLDKVRMYALKATSVTVLPDEDKS